MLKHLSKEEKKNWMKEELLPQKRKRNTGSETLQYLREKSEREMCLKEQEMEVKRKEQSQFELLIKQQQEMMRHNQQQQQAQNALMMQMQQSVLALMQAISDKK